MASKTIYGGFSKRRLVHLVVLGSHVVEFVCMFSVSDCQEGNEISRRQ